MRELADAGHLDGRLVATGDEPLEQVVLRDPLPHRQARPRLPRAAAPGPACAGRAPAARPTTTWPGAGGQLAEHRQSRSADSSCSASARSSGSAARSGRSVQRARSRSTPARSSARRCTSSSVRATTTIARPASTAARRVARWAARAAAGTRSTPGSGRWGRRASTSAATRRSPPRGGDMDAVHGTRRQTSSTVTPLKAAHRVVDPVAQPRSAASAATWTISSASSRSSGRNVASTWSTVSPPRPIPIRSRANPSCRRSR